MPKSERNIDTARRAIEFVMRYERREGRLPRDVSGLRPSRGYDIESSGRFIEVKGMAGRFAPPRLWRTVQERTYDLLSTKPHLYIYLVDNLSPKPQGQIGLYILDAKQALARISGRQVTYSLSVRKDDRERFRVR